MENTRILCYTVNLSAWDNWNPLWFKFRFNSTVNEAINATILTALKDGELNFSEVSFHTLKYYFL